MELKTVDNEVFLIKNSLKSLGLPLLGEPRKTETGYEIIISLEHKKRIAKKTVRELLESKNLSVSVIDVFIDNCGHYAYSVVNPILETEVHNGRSTFYRCNDVGRTSICSF